MLFVLKKSVSHIAFIERRQAMYRELFTAVITWFRANASALKDATRAGDMYYFYRFRITSPLRAMSDRVPPHTLLFLVQAQGVYELALLIPAVNALERVIGGGDPNQHPSIETMFVQV